ncbi:hypothetical protein ZWY2020_010651 [Hordeum vulgare]|nr:hypothetical protein ZWY2020_010651 [Hordeum vulgare]
MTVVCFLFVPSPLARLKHLARAVTVALTLPASPREASSPPGILEKRRAAPTRVDLVKARCEVAGDDARPDDHL